MPATQAVPWQQLSATTGTSVLGYLDGPESGGVIEGDSTLLRPVVFTPVRRCRCPSFLHGGRSKPGVSTVQSSGKYD